MVTNQNTLLEVEKEKVRLQQEQTKNFNKLIDKGFPILERYLNAKLEKIEAPKFKWTFIIFGILLVLILASTAFLTFYDKLNPENFTFLLGILIGSIITLLGDILLNFGGNN